MSVYKEAYLAELKRLVDNVDDLLEYIEERKKPKITPIVTGAEQPEWEKRFLAAERKRKQKIRNQIAWEKKRKARDKKARDLRFYLYEMGQKDRGFGDRYTLHCDVPEKTWGVDERDMRVFTYFPWLIDRSKGARNV